MAEITKFKAAEVAFHIKHDLREIKGTYNELMDRRNYEGTAVNDYLHVVLTDENDVFDAMRKLKSVYSNILRLDYDNARTQSSVPVEGVAEVETKTPFEIVKEFYARQNNQEMNEAQAGYMQEVIERIWGEEE